MFYNIDLTFIHTSTAIPENLLVVLAAKCIIKADTQKERRLAKKIKEISITVGNGNQVLVITVEFGIVLGIIIVEEAIGIGLVKGRA